MKYKKMLSRAIQIATKLHHDQYDRGGNPYILHVFEVMRRLRSDDEELNCIAILHDIIEDTPITYSELSEDYGFSPRVIDAIYALSKRPGQSEQEYLMAIVDNYDAIRVKMCDLQHNMDVSRLARAPTKNDHDRVAKYTRMYYLLDQERREYEQLHRIS